MATTLRNVFLLRRPGGLSLTLGAGCSMPLCVSFFSNEIVTFQAHFASNQAKKPAFTQSPEELMKEYQMANEELKRRRQAKLKALYEADWAAWTVALEAKGLTLNSDA